MSARSDVVVVVTGDPSRTTGGFAYNRRVVEALGQRAGISASQLDISGVPFDAVSSQLGDSRIVFFDSIAFSEPVIVGVAESLLKRPEPRPIVGALMHMLPSELAEKGDPSLLAATEQQLLPQSELVIAVSDYVAAKLDEAGARRERVFVIPPGRDGAGSAIPPVDSDGAKVRFVNVANWAPAKGIDLLLRAFARAEVDATLDLVGWTQDRV
ncbi:MAG: hypothetical protein ACRD1T_07355, partial [Acidimicrobiia bacterium]